MSVNGTTVDVYADQGAMWDGASIPRIAWTLLGVYPGGRMLAPSLPHDGWCDMHRGKHPRWFTYESQIEITPRIRDLIFRESCRYVGILKLQARIMWWAVMLYQQLQCRKHNIKYG